MTVGNLGTIIAIGGREDKEGDRSILTELVRLIGNGKLVLTAVASEEPEELLESYRKIFRDLGVKQIETLEIQTRAEANTPEKAEPLVKAHGVFFTGGDQLRITSQIGDSAVYTELVKIYQRGGVIAGTSAGASVMCATMLTAGKGSESPKAGGIQMAPGLGFVRDAIIDQHFAERGRMGRLLCAIAENPRMLGIGIDEDTAVVFEKGNSFKVWGKGAVYVIDGSTMSYSNIAEESPNETLSLFDVRLHVLSADDSFDLTTRRAVAPSTEAHPKSESTGRLPAPRDPQDKVSKKSKVRSKPRRKANA